MTIEMTRPSIGPMAQSMPLPDCPKASSPAVLRRMRSQRRSGTKAELALRRALAGSGLRLRTNMPVPSHQTWQIDLADVQRRIAIFVDGCFWHVCPIHASFPSRNSAWWKRKLTENQLRDRRVARHLRRHRWQVFRVWEHVDPIRAASRITRATARRDARGPRDGLRASMSGAQLLRSKSARGGT